MKYLKYYEQLLEKKISTKREQILYHGALEYFPKFQNSLSFFAETYTFAEDYASQKSFESGIDSDAIVYKVKFTGNIFDINNTKCYQEMKSKMPRKLMYHYNNFGFDTETTNKEMLFNMKGEYIDHPEEGINDKEVGDEIKIPISMSQYDEYKVYKKDKEYVYAYDQTEYRRQKEGLFEDSYSSWSHKVKEIFKPLFEFIRTLDEKKYISSGLIRMYYMLFTDKKDIYGMEYDIYKKHQKEFDKINDKCEKELIDYLIGRYPKKFLRIPKKKELIDTWRFYENDTVIDIIEDLGYDGYIAKENKQNTWAIFNPDDTIKIIEYNLPYGEFKTPEEIKKFIDWDKALGEKLKKEDDKWWRVVSRSDFSRWWKDDLTHDKVIEKIKKELKEYET